MSFLKHIGKHGERKVCVLWRQVPQEDWMCLVIYPETLPAHWETAIMKVLESDVGQKADEFSDALHRSLLPDGRLILETLHRERMIKKVRSADVLMTPRPNASIRLDELNKMLNEMKTGEEAVRRMAENDASRGLVDPQVKRAAEDAFKRGQQQVNDYPNTLQSNDASGLSDRDIASNLLAQAKRMEAEAKGMIAEASRMKKDAERMFPNVESAKQSRDTTNVPIDEVVELPKKTSTRTRSKPKNKVANATE
jgi:hypothetical protein